MGYLHVTNLYKPEAQLILAFKQVYALEKVHGTSAHLSWRHGVLSFSSGGEKHDRFVALFDQAALMGQFTAIGQPDVVVFGEAYGGKQQGMSATYGKELRFIAFEVQVSGTWLAVPDAKTIVDALGLEFVPFEFVSTDLAALDHERDRPSVVAERRGMGSDKRREGVVLRPPFEVRLNNGDRLIAKHKCAEFAERATPPEVVDASKLTVLANAQAIADEWVTPMRLAHVLDKLPEAVDARAIPVIITAMVEDVEREAAGEIVVSREAKAAIGKKTAMLFKAHLNAQIGDAS